MSETDRLERFFKESRRRRRTLVSPEGVPLEIQVAGLVERFSALLMDLLLMGAAILGLWLAVFWFLARPAAVTGLSAGLPEKLGLTLALFLSFLIRNLYFLYFELAWRGQTPGKKRGGLRVINRRGGELTPAAVVARNLTREMEIFLPLGLMLTDSSGRPALLVWMLLVASLPLWNRSHLRAGDLIAGTLVMAQPRRALLSDLSLEAETQAGAAAYNFTAGQLAIYGVLELQVLEEFLRRRPGPETDRLLAGIVGKIQRKIGWPDPVPPADHRRFLTDFYTAERAVLERGRLFGRGRRP